MKYDGFILKQPGGFFAPDKYPEANLDYSIDWSQWLGADTIAASAWEIPGA